MKLSNQKNQSNKEPNQLPMISNWSELSADLLLCVFKRLSFTNLARAKFVCRWWNSVSRGCLPKPVPCLILFPPIKETTSNNSCVLYVPDDGDKVYRTRDLGARFGEAYCLATYGSWLLMIDHLSELYILNPFTLERIDLPRPDSSVIFKVACLWIDDETRDYLVLLAMGNNMVYTKKGDTMWRRDLWPIPFTQYYPIVYSHKHHKVYTFVDYKSVFVWDFSGDIPIAQGFLPSIYKTYLPPAYTMTRIAVTVSGQVLEVGCIRTWTSAAYENLWHFEIQKFDPEMQKWVNVDSLGDEALILDIGFTVVANDTSGIKRNSIYFKSYPDDIFVYDLTTQSTKRVPQHVFPSIPSSSARWFFPGFTG